MDFNQFLEKEVPECYYSMAVIMGAINYYTLYESWAGEPEEGDARTHSVEDLKIVSPYLNELNDLVKNIYNESCLTPYEYKDKIFALREKIKATAVDITSFADLFALYEYILNRSSHSIEENGKNFNNDAVARDVLSAIFGNNENAIINENIRMMVSQLPLRMTKSKFFAILEDSLRKYIDTDSSSLDREIYMIKSSAGIEISAAEEYEELRALINYFKAVDYSTLDAVSFAEAEAKLRETEAIITDITEFLQACETVVNFLGIIAITGKYIDAERISDIVGMTVLTDEALAGFESKGTLSMSEAALRCLEIMEGKFEPMTEKLQRIQTKIANVYKDNENVDTPAIVYELEICEKLVSTSVFADLTEELSFQLTEKDVLAKFAELKNIFSDTFAEDSKTMLRARMASVLAELPVFFDSRTEVMNYVRESLEGCRDVYEKKVSVDLLMELIR